MYTCTSGEIVERFPDRYLAIWPSPIETVPLLHYTPGGRYLLLSTLGCNLSCPGCVSHILVNNPDLITEAMSQASSEEILHRVSEHSCLGAVFCLNEPTVSIETVIKTSQTLREAGYKVGCASNGCMSPSILDRFLATMDFMNIGMKGSSDEVYQECGAPCNIEHVFDTIQQVHTAGVHLEISVVYQHGREQEAIGVAERLSEISLNIPLHIMRFIPFGEVDADLEPSPDEAEALLSSCRHFLRWVYLFNTPGTGRLSTFCPDCETILIERSFYGPMGARLTDRIEHTQCICGVEVPISGSFSRSQGSEPRYRGGYRTSVILSSVANTLHLLGVRDSQVVSRILVKILSGRWLEDLQGYFSSPEGYIEYIRILSSFAGIEGKVQPLIGFYLHRLEEIQVIMLQAPRPRVYCALSHPFLPSYPDKMEVSLTERAGGEVLNYQIPHDESCVELFTQDQFNLLQPDVIICSGMGKSDLQTFLDHCRQEYLIAPALENGMVFCIPREYSSAGLFWILVLEFLVNALHPVRPLYDLAEEEASLMAILSDLQS
ncbi:MAG: radical SAM protein [Methanobacteriota archaeon]